MGRTTKMNHIVTPELLAQVNPDNIELMNDFLEYLESIQRSETTIAQYKNDLKIAFVWSLKHNNNAFYIDWTKRQVAKFQSWLINENENNSARVRRMKSTLSSLGNYVENILDDEYPNFRNIINRIENPPKELVREKTVVTGEEVEEMLTKLVEDGKIEIACCVALMAYGGRRKSEICRFRLSDFSDDKLICEGSLWKSEPLKTKGRGKGKFINCYTIVSKFKPYLDLWLKEREEKGIESEWLFPDISDMSKQISPSRISSWMETLSDMFDINAYAHMFRHRFTTMLAQAGVPYSVIQSLTSWESSDMVRLYDDTSVDEQFSMYFGAEGIKTVEKKGLSDL